jgi:hypothetical protein
LEANRGVWPACPNRFIGSSKSTKVDLAGAGKSAEITLEADSTQDGAFYLKLGNGKFLSYANDCSNTVMDTWPSAGTNQEFRLLPAINSTYNFEWRFEAVGRNNCKNSATISFPKGCNSDGLAMGAASSETIFHMHAVRNNGAKYDKRANSATGCADPFSWYSATGKGFYLACTGGELDLLKSESMSKDVVFKSNGNVLGGSIPRWAKSGNRWAPENLEVEPDKLQVVFFSDDTGNGDKHRVGWAMSVGKQVRLASSWDMYSKAPMDLGNSNAGEIDQHIFRDMDNKTYLLWKTDDNSVGSKTTHIWGQEVHISVGKVELLGERKMMMDSSGLFWIDSWIEGGSLVEGPELIHHGGYYYLFFAAGKYCQDSYSEGVARSKSIWGPYEKMAVPLLSTGLTGYSGGQKQIGPGHASYVHTAGKYFAVYHASKGENCNRYAFIEELKFDTSSGWPYIDFDAA